MITAGPLVIGGLGGSGTRAVARAAAVLGVDLGSGIVLSTAHDNLLFTLLVKRPRWLLPRLTSERPDAGVLAALDVLARMRTGQSLERRHLAILDEAVAEQSALRAEAPADPRVFGAGAPDPPDIAAAGVSALPASGPWGWKEPNSHLVLPELISCFPDLVYVHVIRHPLDMAYSDNLTQVRLWGKSAGIDVGLLDPPDAQLRWWLHSTELACRRGAHLGERFLLLHFDDFCTDPQTSLETVARLVGLTPAGADVQFATTTVTSPPTAGRWRSHDWRALDEGARRAAGAYGFDVGG